MKTMNINEQDWNTNNQVPIGWKTNEHALMRQGDKEDSQKNPES